MERLKVLILAICVRIATGEPFQSSNLGDCTQTTRLLISLFGFDPQCSYAQGTEAEMAQAFR